MARTECVSACASMPLSKAPADMTLDELAQEKWKREDNLDHLQAKAEVLRRESQSQLNAWVSQKRNARYMLWSAIAAAVSAAVLRWPRLSRPTRQRPALT
jgi:hypothetical protein